MIREVILTGQEVTHKWGRVEFHKGYFLTPTVFAAMQTAAGGDTAQVCLRKVNTASFQVKIEEEKTDDSERKHTSEAIGAVVFDFASSLIWNEDDQVIGQVGFLERNQPDEALWHRVEFNPEIERPVVFMQVLSFRGHDPVHIRLAAVEEETATRPASFFFKLEEWREQKHGDREEIAYLVLSEGVHRVRTEHPDDHGLNPIHVGKFMGDHTWQPTGFRGFLPDTAPPVVIRFR